MAKYDFLIVGAGFFGATCARKLTDAGFKCLVIEKEPIVGGLAATEEKDGIMIHKYGEHVLYTDDDIVWNFLSKYDTILPINKYVKCFNLNKYYSFPLTMNLFNEVYGTIYPKDAKKQIENDIKEYGVEYRRNLEEDGIYKGGFKPYILTMKGYYEKLFGLEAKDLSIANTTELKTRYDYSSGYYSEYNVGIPSSGYTKMLENIIGDDIDILLNKDYITFRERFNKLANYVICTCPIDKFCNYIYGPLPWVSINYELKDYSGNDNFLGVGTVRVSDTNNGLLEMIEHKSIVPTESDKNYVSFATVDKWNPDKKCMYAINNDNSEALLDKYITFVNENFPNVIFGGRQGIYRNLSICESVKLALDLCNDIITTMHSA